MPLEMAHLHHLRTTACYITLTGHLSLSSTLENATSTSLMNLTTTPLCNISDIPPDGIKNKAVVVQWGTCHFLEKAKIAQTGGAEALLVANNSVLVSY